MSADQSLPPASPSTPTPLTDLGAFHVLRDVEVEVALEIGRRRMRIAKAAGEPIDIYVNGQLLGRGEAVVVNERYGVRITELIAREQGGKP
jgi:flagellar motor switch protein FliN/FliY